MRSEIYLPYAAKRVTNIGNGVSYSQSWWSGKDDFIFESKFPHRSISTLTAVPFQFHQWLISMLFMFPFSVPPRWCCMLNASAWRDKTWLNLNSELPSLYFVDWAVYQSPQPHHHLLLPQKYVQPLHNSGFSEHSVTPDTVPTSLSSTSELDLRWTIPYYNLDLQLWVG